MTERAQRLDGIRKHAETLDEISTRYRRLLWLAEQDGSDAFLGLAEAAGQLTTQGLDQLRTLLELGERGGRAQ